MTIRANIAHESSIAVAPTTDVLRRCSVWESVPNKLMKRVCLKGSKSVHEKCPPDDDHHDDDEYDDVDVSDDDDDDDHDDHTHGMFWQKYAK